jgi:hypothetical protein
MWLVSVSSKNLEIEISKKMLNGFDI